IPGSPSSTSTHRPGSALPTSRRTAASSSPRPMIMRKEYRGAPGVVAGMTLRSDAMLLTRGRPGTERLIGAALLLDGIPGGQLGVKIVRPERRRDGIEAFGPRLERRRVVAGPERAESPLMAEVRARAMSGPPDSPAGWIKRTAEFAPARVAAELVLAGAAAP